MSARIAVVALGLALLTLTGCAGGSMTGPSDAASTPPHPSLTPLTPMPSGVPTTVPDAKWSAIEKDLADRGVVGTPTLVSAEAVTWRNSSLGCPKPGAMYTQALVEGMRVVVSVDAKTYDYRFGADDVPVLCTNAGPRGS